MNSYVFYYMAAVLRKMYQQACTPLHSAQILSISPSPNNSDHRLLWYELLSLAAYLLFVAPQTFSPQSVRISPAAHTKAPL